MYVHPGTLYLFYYERSQIYHMVPNVPSPLFQSKGEYSTAEGVSGANGRAEPRNLSIPFLIDGKLSFLYYILNLSL